MAAALRPGGDVERVNSRRVEEDLPDREATDGISSVDLNGVLATLRRYWRSIVAVTLISAAIGVGVFMTQKPAYTSGATVNFLPKSGGAAGELKAALEYAQGQAETFAQLAGTPVVLDPVAQQVGLGDANAIAGQCVTAASATQAVINVTCTRPDPQSAAALANAIADQIGVALKTYAPAGTDQTLESRVTVRANPSATPSSPNLRTSLPVPLAVGLLLGLGQAFLRGYLDNRIETPEDVARLTKVPVIGEIPLIEDEADGKNHRRMESFSLREEAYRRLRTNLQFRALEGHGNVMVVTSSMPGEGKTATASAIATAFAQTNQRVLLVDCDLRRPRVHQAFHLDNSTGLSTALLNNYSVADVVQRVDGLSILPSGPKPPNPSELLGSPAMQRLYDDARAHFDVVIFDSPPLLPVTDATVLARMGAGAVLVADTGRVRTRQLTTALKNLSTVEAPVLGLVLNKIRVGIGYYGYGPNGRYAYDYAYSSEPGKPKRFHGKKKPRATGRSAKAPRG